MTWELVAVAKPAGRLYGTGWVQSRSNEMLILRFFLYPTTRTLKHLFHRSIDGIWGPAVKRLHFDEAVKLLKFKEHVLP